MKANDSCVHPRLSGNKLESRNGAGHKLIPARSIVGQDIDRSKLRSLGLSSSDISCAMLSDSRGMTVLFFSAGGRPLVLDGVCRDGDPARFKTATGGGFSDVGKLPFFFLLFVDLVCRQLFLEER